MKKHLIKLFLFAIILINGSCKKDTFVNTVGVSEFYSNTNQ